MNCDFTTLRDGFAQGSYKWNAMRAADPEVPEGIVPLSVADMEFPLSTDIADGICEAIRTTVLGYNAPTDGYYEAVTGWMRKRHGWEIDKEAIVPYQGVVPMIEQAILAFTAPGDGVLILSPVYHPFRMMIEKTGRRIVSSSLREEEGVYTIDFDDVRKKAADARLFLLCSPHNPVGRVWETGELEQLAAIAKEQDLTVFSDEIHHDLALTKTHTVFAKVASGVKTLIATAPTKTFNLAGAKVSNLIAEDPALRERFTSRGELAPSVPGLIACEQAYRRGGPWLDALKDKIRENEAVFRGVIRQKAPIIRISPLEGTYLLWADLRAMAQEPEERIRFVQAAHVFPNFGEIFGEEGMGFIRVNLAAPTEVIRGAAERLADGIERRACCW